MHESALIQRIGGAETMAGQLDHLLTMTDQSNVVLQVIPLKVGAYPGFGTSYHLINFDDGAAAGSTWKISTTACTSRRRPISPHIH